jgi:hypothetical protein
MTRHDTSGGMPAPHPLTPRLLARVEESLGRGFPVADLMTRSPVMAVLPDFSTQRLYDEVGVPLTALAERLIPDVDLGADPWLLRHLAALVNQRLMVALADRAVAAEARSGGGGGIGLVLSVRDALSPAFARFDGWVRANALTPVVITLDPVDALVDPGAFVDVRDGLRDQGYRLCLDGGDARILDLVDRAALGVDLVRILWRANLATDLADDGSTRLKRLCDKVGRGRVLLAGVETESALRQGHAVGVTLFQGPWCEAALAA